MPAPQPGQGALDQHFGASVHRTGGLVQDQHLGPAEEGPRDGQELPLPGAEDRAVLVDHGVIARRQGADEIIDEAGARGLDDLVLTRAGRAEDGHGLARLGCQAHILEQRHGGIVAELHLVEDGPACRCARCRS